MNVTLQISKFTARLKIIDDFNFKKKINKLKQNKIKVSFLFRHEGKVFSCKDISFFISEDLTWSLVAGPVFLPRELSTNLKNTDFCFWNIGKTRDFVVKHYINFVYMMRISFFFLRFTIFEISFIFSYWNKNFKRIG